MHLQEPDDNYPQINTGGGDVVGRDKIIQGDEVHGDKVMGDKFETHHHYQRPPLGTPFQAPPLPVHFVPRPEITDALRSRLLTENPTTPGSLVVSAIHGMAGIGKTQPN